ncbi:MAG: DNA replication/repair protein RecF [Leadbetterella sp.]
MYLKKLQLVEFRNYENRLFEFSAGLNCIVGKNGSGKTNLLDAIHYLTHTKSALHGQDVLGVRHEGDSFQIDGLFSHPEKDTLVSCFFSKHSKKTMSQDKVPIPKYSEYLGSFPSVLILPDDTDLIRDSSDTRRRLFDGIISTINKSYLSDLISYQKNLDQRNALLKQYLESKRIDKGLLHIYTDNLIEIGHQIYTVRKAFTEQFYSIFLQYYVYLSSQAESPEILFDSVFNFDDAPIQIKKAETEDLLAGRSTKGIHKDDFIFLLDNKPIKKLGSQGQRKSFVMAIRMAQFSVIQQSLRMKPILLLDDIFDKLDETRISKLLEMIQDKTFAQVFITDARPERTRQLLSKFEVSYHEID